MSEPTDDRRAATNARDQNDRAKALRHALAVAYDALERGAVNEARGIILEALLED